MSDASAVPGFSRAAQQRISRIVLTAGTALGILCVPLTPAGAQESNDSTAQSSRPWNLRFTSGALVATGAQRNSFKDAQLSAAGVSWHLRPSLAITGTFSWARSRVLDVADRGKVDVFNSDLGLEVETKEWSPSGPVRLRLFAAAGAGVRTYHYRTSAVDATNHPAGYLAVGSDVGVGRVGVRLEARDYLSRFTPLVGAGTSEMRNDVVITAGLHFKKRRAN